MRNTNLSISPNRNLNNISYSPNHYNYDKPYISQSTKNIFKSHNLKYSLNEKTYQTTHLNSPYQQRNPNPLEKNYNLSNSSSLNNLSNGGNYINYKKINSCKCDCHCCELYCCQELLKECQINGQSDKLCIEKLIRNKDFLMDENGKLKKHILILTDQNQNLICELETIVSSSDCCTIDINHNGINHLNNVINDNRCRLEKSLDDLEKTINQRKIELN